MSKSYSTICLNMIVKNESHIIEKTLNNICSQIPLHYWVIGDNGSTDGTQEIILKFFKKKKIKGILYEDKWVDFGHNRSEALKKAYNKTDYVFIFDADDYISGKMLMPSKLVADFYQFTFGHPDNVQYHRALLVNNRLKWSFKGVLHEYIKCDEENHKLTSDSVKGDYFVISGRSGNRNTNPNKYRDDAKVLENGYYKALEEKDDISDRYAYYCAQSYRDAGMFDDAIKWYKITLTRNGWVEEKYVSCLTLYELYQQQNNNEMGFFYLVESHKYSTQRVEAARILIQHYCADNCSAVAFSYYTLIQEYFENHMLNDNLSTKLFARNHDYYFYLPYFMIITSERVRKYEVGIKMYEIIFTKKIMIHEWWHNNLIHNLQFFIDKVNKKSHPNFFNLLNDYLIALQNANIVLDNDLVKLFVRHGLNPNNIKGFNNKVNKDSNKILIFAGFGCTEWNQTYLETNSLGGSETAVINLTKCFPKKYDIYVGGIVKEEKVNNITYVNLGNLPNLIRENHFHAIIISRYISFLEMFPYYSSNKVFVWIHDTVMSNYGCNIQDIDILKKHNRNIDKYVCLTDWHKNHISNIYPLVKNKINIINNGINLSIFPPKTKKIPNSFIYSSCSERGLSKVLNMWGEILKHLPDAQLFISSYNPFPHNDDEKEMNIIVQKYDSIHHLGKLSQPNLYKQMALSEYWLYPTNWPETSCITSLEMLMNEVICLYYPLAGLVNTLGEYGVVIEPNKEIEKLISLTDEDKIKIREKGRQYAEKCSWQNREKVWYEMINHADKECIKPLKSETNNEKDIKKSNNDTKNQNNETKNQNNDTNTQNNDKEITIIPQLLDTNLNKDYIIEFNKCSLTHHELDQISHKSRKIKWVVYYGPIFNIEPVRKYIDNLNKYNEYDIIFVQDNVNEAINARPDKITFLHIPFEAEIFTTFTNIEIGCINTEPLNIVSRLEDVRMYVEKYPALKLYDYSLSNIKILEDIGISNVEHLPYLYNISEINMLRHFYKNEQRVYDFGIVVSGCSKDNKLPISPPRRNLIVQKLIKHFKVNIIHGWGDDRDIELSKCKIILNIHGQTQEEDYSPPERTSLIFENIRCDRLLNAGYKILSETSLHLDDRFVNFYPNLKICNFDDFLNIETMTNILQDWDSEKYTLPKSSKKKWFFYHVDTLNSNSIKQYISNLETDEYFTYLISDLQILPYIKPNKFTIIIQGIQEINQELFNNFKNIDISFLNIEPLNLKYRINNFKKIVSKYPQVKIFDYNEANIAILQSNNITNIELLPYQFNTKENKHLKYLYENEDKTFDFGILVDYGQNIFDAPFKTPYRFKVVDFIKKHFTINIIEGWGVHRDKQLAKCRYILNIHSQLYTKINKELHVQDSNMFQHIRCNRLLDAGFQVLSEKSNSLSSDFIHKYPNLTLWDYKDFFNIHKISNLISNNSKLTSIINLPTNNIQNVCFIHSCNISGAGLKVLNKIINLIKSSGFYYYLNNIYIINIGLPIDSNYYKDDNKIQVNNFSLNSTIYEMPTINKIVEFSKNNPNSNILYLHTKGVSHIKNNNTTQYYVNDWSNMMLHFLVEKHQHCINILNNKNVDTIGCNYHPNMNNIPQHWSGNFWWAKSQYLSNLPSLQNITSSNDCEFWLFKNNPAFIELHNSQVNHYHEYYPKHKYASLQQSSSSKKFIDAFIFYNELDLLKYRLAILYDSIDYFIIVEATHTHIGKEKPLNFKENKHLFTEYLDKIIYIVVDDFPYKYPNCSIADKQQWVNEKFQRCCIQRGLDKLNLEPDDVIFINDLDEIVDPSLIQKIKNDEYKITWNILEMDFYYYNLTTQLDHKWWQSKAISYGYLTDAKLNCDDVRFGNYLHLIPHSGWHLSYFGSPDFISNKIKNFTHQEHNTEKETKIENIENKIKEHKHLFSDNVTCKYISTENNDYLPPMYDTLLSKYC